MQDSEHKVKRHHDRDDLVGEHPFGDAGQLILAALFFIIWITDTFFLHLTTFPNQLIPPWIRVPLGIALLLLAGYMAKKSTAIVFGEVRQEPAVIRKSLFKYLRHPMYMSEILLYLGLITISISLASFGIGIIAFFFLNYIASHEEKMLLARFGEDYANYMRDVPRWLPRF